MESKIIHGDCLDVMRGMADKSVDCIVTDTPYGIDLAYDGYEDSEKNWYDLMSKAIPEMRRVAKMVIMPSCKISRLKWIYDNAPPIGLSAGTREAQDTLLL